MARVTTAIQLNNIKVMATPICIVQEGKERERPAKKIEKNAINWKCSQRYTLKIYSTRCTTYCIQIAVQVFLSPSDFIAFNFWQSRKSKPNYTLAACKFDDAISGMVWPGTEETETLSHRIYLYERVCTIECWYWFVDVPVCRCSRCGCVWCKNLKPVR